MKAKGCGDVDPGIGMVDAVDAPQDRYLVKHDVFEPDGEVQRDKGDQAGKRRGDAESREHAVSASLSPDSNAGGGSGKGDAKQEGG